MSNTTERDAQPLFTHVGGGEFVPLMAGHDGKVWPETADGKCWAEAFHARFPAVSVDDALGWFCNAIMRGWDTHAARATPREAAPPAAVEALRELVRQHDGPDEEFSIRASADAWEAARAALQGAAAPSTVPQADSQPHKDTPHVP